MFNTPILFLIFNRPKHSQAAFERIREIKPTHLFISADGPRKGNADDQTSCALTRKTVLDMIDWPCQVETLFREENLGCGAGPAEGITWFFNHVENGIILEDDCLPDLSFFSFCEELLNRYKDTPEIMHISGNNFQYGIQRGKYSYYFSAYTHNWGWATWRNRWMQFDFEMKGYTDQFIPSIAPFYNFAKEEITFWQNSFTEMVKQNRMDIWDFRWLYAVWKNHGVSVLPQINLVKNIGFDQQATHTYSMPENVMSMGAGEMKNISHPPAIILDRAADLYSLANHFNPQPSRTQRLAGLVVRVVKKIIQTVLVPGKLRSQFSRFRNFTSLSENQYRSNLQLVLKFRQTRGCVVECGSGKGGMIAGMVNVLGLEKRYYLFDEFTNSANGDTKNESEARKVMQLSGAKHFVITNGKLKETLEGFAPPEGISILRLGMQQYDSAIDCLNKLFNKINDGGMVIVEGCRDASGEIILKNYVSENKLSYQINSYKGVYYIVKA